MKNILIADSGSTKTDWLMVENKNVVKSFTTIGLNPFHQSEENLTNQMKVHLGPYINGLDISHVYFYGAGVLTEAQQNSISRILSPILPHSEIEVDSDLLGAARALFQNQKGIACILGTGSNSGLYNGSIITEKVSAGGYILGDEGSGAYFGKILASDYLKKIMPENLSVEFEKTFSLTPDELIENVYRKPFANKYLANFATFLKPHLNEEYINKMVHSGFDNFFERNVLRYSGYKNLEIGFIGSIAYEYDNFLTESAKKFDISRLNVTKSPMEGLLKFHEIKK